MRGVVVIPHGFDHEDATHLKAARSPQGPNVNRLAPSRRGTLEVFAGMSQLTATGVDVTRVDVRVEAGRSDRRDETYASAE